MSKTKTVTMPARTRLTETGSQTGSHSLAGRTHLRHQWPSQTTWLFLLLVFLCSPARGQDLIVRGGWLFDAVGDAFVQNTVIVIRGGKFVRIGVSVPDVDRGAVSLIQLGDEDYILPGIFDLHAHYNINVMGRGRIDETDHYSVIYLANGVTSTFPAGEYNPIEMLEMRKRIDRGEQIGPRVYNSGPYYGQSMPRRATTQDVNERVDMWAALGARGFKAKRINPEQLEALIKRAHQHGLTVTGHLDSGFRNSVNPRDAILMGIDRIEHFLGGDLLPASQSAYDSLENLTETMLDSAKFREIVNLFLERGVFFDATLTAYGYFGKRGEVYQQWVDESKYFTPEVRLWATGQPQQFIEQFEKIYHVKHMTLKRFYDAGGLITLGTDHASTGEYLAGFAAHRELDAFVRAGIKPVDALKIATINGARALNVSDKLGSIEVGKFADLFIIRGDPLDDIRNTRNVHTVVKGGVAYDSAELLRSVEGKLGPFDTEEPTPDGPQ